SLSPSTPPATAAIYTLSLHDALPICCRGGRPLSASSSALNALLRAKFPHMREYERTRWRKPLAAGTGSVSSQLRVFATLFAHTRSEEHTSELQSRGHLVCRLLLEKKK